jgi:hypothetical protein
MLMLFCINLVKFKIARDARVPAEMVVSPGANYEHRTQNHKSGHIITFKLPKRRLDEIHDLRLRGSSGGASACIT